MKIKYQIAILAVASVMVRPILAENVVPQSEQQEQTLQPSTSQEKPAEPKRSSKKPPLTDVVKLLKDSQEKGVTPQSQRRGW